MSARNFPPSFWNSNYVHPTPAPTHPQVSNFINLWETNCFRLLFIPQVSDLYGADGGYSTDPWVPHAAHYGSYAHAAHAHAAHAHAYHHNMAQYGSLLRLPQQYGHSSRWVFSYSWIPNYSKTLITYRLHHEQQAAHALESAAAYSSYPTMAGKTNLYEDDDCGTSSQQSVVQVQTAQWNFDKNSSFYRPLFNVIFFCSAAAWNSQNDFFLLPLHRLS